MTCPALRHAPGVYLIHFDRKLHHAGHYLGSADDVADRIRQHASGRGARLMEVVNKQGIGWVIAEVWYCSDHRLAEKTLKRRHDSPAVCPICKGH